MIELEQLPFEVTSHIQKFRSFLLRSWDNLESLMEDHDWDADLDFIDEWLQVNWEFLVERELLGQGQFLVPLEHNKRVTFSNSHPSFIISCNPLKNFDFIDFLEKKKNYNNETLMLFAFYTRRNTAYRLHPPFDYVCACTLDRKKRYMIPIDDCQFFLKRLNPTVD